jgi:hypothetical protein
MQNGRGSPRLGMIMAKPAGALVASEQERSPPVITAGGLRAPEGGLR